MPAVLFFGTASIVWGCFLIWGSKTLGSAAWMIIGSVCVAIGLMTLGLLAKIVRDRKYRELEQRYRDGERRLLEIT